MLELWPIEPPPAPARALSEGRAMCVAFPSRVTGVDSAGATVEVEGRRRRASTLLIPEIAVGDWVVVAAGTIVDRLEPQVAQEILATLRRAVALDDAGGARDRTEASR